MHKILFLFITVILSGCTAICGEKGNKDTVPTSRTLSQTAEDMRISAAIHTDLAALDLYKPIDVNVRGGKVIYTGSVPTEKDSFMAVGVAWKQNGVNGVINELKVENQKSSMNAKQYAKDTWITTTFKAKALKDKDIKSPNYTIVTTNGTVYIFGMARSVAELNKVKAIAREIDGVKNVVSHVHINPK